MSLEQARIAVPFKLKEIADAGQFSGLGSTFGNVDLGNDVVEHGAFAESLAERVPKMLWQHDWFEPIGVWTDAKETKQGLELDGSLVMETQRGREAHALMKAGAVDGLSIGFAIRDAEFDDDGIRHLKNVELMEVSVVTFPMNELAQVTAVKARLAKGEIISKRELEAILRDVGFSQGQAKGIIADGHSGLFQRDAEVSDDAALLSAIRNLSQRIVDNGH